MKSIPPVSCSCVTYGRSELLEEAIYSFLQQDYEGEKELVVLNDYSQQILEFDHPEVQIFNVAQRFRTLGEKRNAAVSLCSHDIIFVWDDDDICLPHRISFSIEMFDQGEGFFKPNQALVWNNQTLSGPAHNLFHSNSCWSRGLFDRVRGYAPMGSGEDFELEVRFQEKHKSVPEAYDIKLEDIYYVYRWGGTGSYHLSALAAGKSGQNSGYEEVGAYVKQEAEQGRIKLGHLKLNPHWQADYSKLARDFLANLETETQLSESRQTAAALPVVNLEQKLSIGIKTFERPECALTLVESIRRFYPDVYIMVVDDGHNCPELSSHANLDHIRTDFYIGVSAGRNLLIERCPTEYMVLLDDDIAFTEDTVLETFVAALDNTHIDIIGGKWIDVDLVSGETNERPYQFCISTEDGVFRHISTNKGYIGKYLVYELINNFFACKIASVKKVLWDPDLKTHEYGDFFIRAKQAGLVVAYTDEVSIEHRPVSNPTYYKYRSDFSYHEKFMAMYGFTDMTYE